MTQNGRLSFNDMDGGLGQGCGPNLIFYFIIGVVLMTLFSCKSIQYVPVVEHHTDTVELTKIRFDSIYAHDSIFIHEYTKGDTVYLELKKWQTKYVEKQVHDTTYIATHDTIPRAYEVERKLTAYEHMKMEYGGYAILLVIFSLLFVLLRFTRKLLPRW